MGLKVGLELASRRDQCKSEFLHRLVSFFGTAERPAGVVHGLLCPVLFSDQGCADGHRGDSQIEEEFFTWLRGAQ